MAEIVAHVPENIPICGPLSQASFWNVVFEEVGNPMRWVNGMSVTSDMGEIAARCLLMACRGEKWPPEQEKIPHV